jgi:hypothetical protein
MTVTGTTSVASGTAMKITLTTRALARDVRERRLPDYLHGAVVHFERIVERQLVVAQVERRGSLVSVKYNVALTSIR